MAYWRIKKVNGCSYVFVYSYKDGKHYQVTPRSDYKHLDAFISGDHHNIDTWVKEWGLKNEKVKRTEDQILFSDDRLAKHVRDFVEYQKVKLKRSPNTYKEHQSLLTRFVVPYFLELSLKDPQAWPGASVGLIEYLEGRGVNPPTIHSVNKTLRIFWKWLLEEHIVTGGQHLHLRNPLGAPKVTPLERFVKPEEVLQFVGRQAFKYPSLPLLALLGYFFSLRPQEVFALKAECFVGGDDALFLECSKAMKEMGLFNRLAVNILDQRTSTGKFDAPKGNSKGWVGCFNEQGAKLIVEEVNKHGDDSFFKVKNRELYKQWSKGVVGTELEGVTLKDLRRSSLYWLGHNTKFSTFPVLLMKHARHQEMETTMLYLRRPEEVVKVKSKLSL